MRLARGTRKGSSRQNKDVQETRRDKLNILCRLSTRFLSHSEEVWDLVRSVASVTALSDNKQ
jgi:hypothetical protein